MKQKMAFLFFILLVTLIFPVELRVSEPAETNKTAPDRESLVSLLPKESEASGWKISSSPQFFVPDNLWEYINGQAELYLGYGFQLVATSDYASKEGTNSLNIEIYMMESPHHAFGIYAAERSPEDEFIKIGVQGYLAENTLNFWNGQFYVKLTSFNTSPGLREILIKLANVIASKIKGNYSEPELFVCFPEKNKVRMSERYIPQNFLGHPFFKNGYRVDYENEGKRYQVILVQNNSPKEAEDAFAKYENFLKSENASIAREGKLDYQEIKVKSRTSSVFFQFESLIGGVQNIQDFAEGEEIIAEMLTKLRERK